MSIKVLLIGAGPTSALIAYNLSKITIPMSKFLDIYIWEKANIPGGRFSTSTFQNQTQVISADLGAQYLTHTRGQKWSEPYFQELVESGLLKELDTSGIPGFRVDDTKVNYIPTQGTGAIVKHLFKKSNLYDKISWNREVASVKIKDKIQVLTAGSVSEQITMTFDFVISAIPVPQFLQLGISDFISLDSGLYADLSAVKYTSRFALALYFDRQIKLQGGEKQFNFIREKDNPICYWAIRQDPDSNSSSVIIHTNVTFGKENLEESLEKIEKILLEKANRLIKSIKNLKPVGVKCHRWNYSQVEFPFKEATGFLEISNPDPTGSKLSSSAHLILAGDGFSYSGFEGCILSARKCTDFIVSKLVE